MKLFKKMKKPVFLLGVLMLAGFITGCGAQKEESYRSIKVHAVEGKGWVTREGVGELELYANMQLQSNDQLRTESESYVQLKLDEDKYVLVEPDTIIKIEAEGNEQDSRTKIVLEKGAVVNRIENKLSENSSYEVETPNSTMAVRGTTFRVTTWSDENGKPVTEIEVQEGKVECIVIAKKADGTVSEQSVTLEGGRKTIIGGSLEGVDYIEEPREYTYDAYENQVLTFIGYSEEKVQETEETADEIETETEEVSTEEETTVEETTVEETTEEKTSEEIPEEKTPEEEQINEELPNEETPKEQPTGITNNALPGNMPGSTNSGTPGNIPGSTGNSTGATGSGNVTDGTGGGNVTGDTTTETTKYTVSFKVGNNDFATQSVSGGENAVKPLLMPDVSGKWSVDGYNDYFSNPTPITGDTVLTWIP